MYRVYMSAHGAAHFVAMFLINIRTPTVNHVSKSTSKKLCCLIFNMIQYVCSFDNLIRSL